MTATTGPRRSRATTRASSVAPAESTPRMADEDLLRLMSLLKGADTVELKLTVPAEAHRATIDVLGLDPVEAQPRQIFFFDTPDLALDKAGVVVRARRISGGRGDTVVKLRPVDPAALSPELRKNAAFNVEVDVLPGGFVCSGSFKGKTTGQEVREAIHGTRPLRKVFGKDQRAFYAQHAPEGLELDSLVPLGPTFVLKGAVQPAELGGRRFVAEMWLYPDGTRILELSTKCMPTDAFQVAGEARAYLVGRGVTLGGAQQTKTRTALQFFQAQLAAAGR
jgi:hypothetical protein